MMATLPGRRKSEEKISLEKSPFNNNNALCLRFFAEWKLNIMLKLQPNNILSKYQWRWVGVVGKVSLYLCFVKRKINNL